MALAAAGGVLTHYQFVIVAVVGFAYAVVRLWGVDRGWLLRVLGSCAAGALIFVGSPPSSTCRSGTNISCKVTPSSSANCRGGSTTSGRPSTRSWDCKVDDLRHAPSSLSIVTRPFWSPLSDGLVAVAVAALLVVAIVVLVVAWRSARLRPRLAAYRQKIDTTGLFVTAFFAVGIGAGLFGMYLSFQDPDYATRPRYLAPLYPFMAMMVVLVARLLVGRARYVAVAALCLFVLVPASLGRVATFGEGPTNAGTIARAHHIVDDGALRGTVVRMLFWVPPQTQVYVALDQDLLAHPDRWLGTLQPNDLYIGVHAYKNTPSSIAAVENVLKTRFVVSRRHLGVRGTGQLNVLKPLPGSSGTTQP